MSRIKWQTALAVLGASALVVSCASLNPFASADERWADYKSWTKITEGKPGTGDPTGFIGNVHNGPDGYREVYVNDIGAAAIAGSAPYNYPEGTIVVKEQFKDKAAFDAGKVAAVTVSVKATGGDALSKDNWIWADSYKGKAKASDFCAGCHSIAAANDFVFTNGDFLKTQ
ncbi:MAG: cytochrome P460 family protein [Gammaproteobacteria bacterium]|nr:cytochrome P460 family protein [Gammaproteobacteria bacterium]